MMMIMIRVFTRHMSGLSEGEHFPGDRFRGGDSGSYGSGDTGGLHPPHHPAPNLNSLERGDLRYER